MFAEQYVEVIQLMLVLPCLVDIWVEAESWLMVGSQWKMRWFGRCSESVEVWIEGDDDEEGPKATT